MDDLDRQIMDVISTFGGICAYRCTEIIRGNRLRDDDRREWNSTYLRVLSHLKSLQRHGFLQKTEEGRKVLYTLPEN